MLKYLNKDIYLSKYASICNHFCQKLKIYNQNKKYIQKYFYNM